MFATYRKLPLGDAITPRGPLFAPAVTWPVCLSTPVEVLRVNDDTLASLKLVTNASAPVPAVGVAVGVLPPPWPFDCCRRPLPFLHETVFSVAARITTAGISRMTFLSAMRRDEHNRLRCIQTPFPAFRSKKTTASQNITSVTQH